MSKATAREAGWWGHSLKGRRPLLRIAKSARYPLSVIGIKAGWQGRVSA